MPSPSPADRVKNMRSRVAVPNRRFLRLVIGLVIVAALVPVVPALAVVWTAASILIVLLAASDFLFRPARGCISVRRELRPIQHVGRKSSYTLTVKNETSSKYLVRVREILPAALEGEGLDERFALQGQGEVIFEIELVGLERGDHRLLPTGVRVSRPLGLFEIHELLEHPESDDSVLVAPGRPAKEADWILSRAALVEELGERRVRRRGNAREFESLRPYVIGDEVRHIDWKASARRMKPQVRLYEAERNAEVILALDCGRLMGGLVNGIRKLDLAMTPVLDLASVALRRKERLGFLAFDSEPRAFVPPRSGLPQLQEILTAMARLPAGASPTSFLRAVRHLETRHRKRSLIIFFTDFTDELSAQEMYRSLAALTRRHAMIFVGVGDPHLEEVHERSGNDVRSIFEKAVAGDLLLERRRVMAQIARLGVFTVDDEPSRLSGPLITKYLEVRLRGAL